jgi:serine/threonine protein kinase
MIDAINEALAGRYRVDSLAAHGGMAAVYRATDLRHDRTVAIKVMNPEYAASVGRERFLREIRVTAGLSHPHLLALYDSGEIGDLLFYVMPFVEGISLRQRIQLENHLPIDDVVRIVRESAEALAYAHERGIVHRDIKPENIMLAGYTGDARGRWNTLVADFGVSAITTMGHDHLTATGLAVGSPQYMSPEQAVGERVDARTDVWALGCVAFEMIEGRSPRGVPSFTRRDVPLQVSTAILRALSQDPAQRYDDALQLADAIEPKKAVRAAGYSKWLMAGAAASVLAVGGAVAYRSMPRAPVHGTTSDSLAMAFYQRGLQGMLVHNVPRAVQAFDDFSSAIRRDSNFALAWAGLSRVAQMALLRGFQVHQLSRDSVLALTLFASHRALMLDSTSAEVWLAHARVLETLDPTTRHAVLTDLRRALAIDSTNGETWFALARARDELLDSARARFAYERAVSLAPRNTELLSFFAMHGLWTNQPAQGLKWADSALAIDPTYPLAREAAALLAIELHNWPLAERQVDAYQRIATGPDVVSALGHAARLASLRGDLAKARRLAAQAERLVDSATITKHQAAYLAEGLSAAGDTAGAAKWLAVFAPRGDVHYQSHLHLDPALAWVATDKYKWLLIEPDTTSR